MPPIRVLQIGMTKNIGGLETYLMQQFRHLDKSKVVYDFVNITDNFRLITVKFYFKLYLYFILY